MCGNSLWGFFAFREPGSPTVDSQGRKNIYFSTAPPWAQPTPRGRSFIGAGAGGGGALLRGSSLNSLLGAKCQESELNPRPSCLGAVWLPDCGRGSGRGNGRSLPSRLFQCVESSMPGTWYPSPLCWNMGQKSFRSSLLAYPMWF